MTERSHAGRRLFASAFLLVAAAAASAHELGTLRTTVVFSKGGTWTAEVTIDREHLPPGFASARAFSPAATIEGLPRELPRGAVSVMGRVAADAHAFFDGREVAPDRRQWIPAEKPDAEWKLRLTGPIPGGARAFAWESASRLGSYLLTVRTEGDPVPQRIWLEGGERSSPLTLRATVVPPTRGQVALQYLKLGYTHILPKGTDHILFVLGIFLLSVRLRPVLLQVTAFTVAHTITLALTIYGVVSLPASFVEPAIAISIVYVAVENVLRPKLSPWRVALVFAFGLLHGMGFAGVLSQLGLPRSEFLPALLSFNAGVELGQLSVILAAFLLIGLPFREKPWYRRRIVIPLSLAIAAVGLFWAVQRIWGS